VKKWGGNIETGAWGAKTLPYFCGKINTKISKRYPKTGYDYPPPPIQDTPLH